MTEPLHSATIPHLPPFITAPGETDMLFVVTALFVLLAVIGIGVFYFKLHAMPEQLAHRGQKMQFQIVAVLTLISLFTHNHAFWIAGLLLALVPLPDFTTPLTSIASSLNRIATNAVSAAPVPLPARDEASPPASDQPIEQREPSPGEYTSRPAAPPASDQPIEQRGA